MCRRHLRRVDTALKGTESNVGSARIVFLSSPPCIHGNHVDPEDEVLKSNNDRTFSSAFGWNRGPKSAGIRLHELHAPHIFTTFSSCDRVPPYATGFGELAGVLLQMRPSTTRNRPGLERSLKLSSTASTPLSFTSRMLGMYVWRYLLIEDTLGCGSEVNTITFSRSMSPDVFMQLSPELEKHPVFMHVRRLSKTYSLIEFHG